MWRQIILIGITIPVLPSRHCKHTQTHKRTHKQTRQIAPQNYATAFAFRNPTTNARALALCICIKNLPLPRRAAGIHPNFSSAAIPRIFTMIAHTLLVSDFLIWGRSLFGICGGVVGLAVPRPNVLVKGNDLV